MNIGYEITGIRLEGIIDKTISIYYFLKCIDKEWLRGLQHFINTVTTYWAYLISQWRIFVHTACVLRFLLAVICKKILSQSF